MNDIKNSKEVAPSSNKIKLLASIGIILVSVTLLVVQIRNQTQSQINAFSHMSKKGKISKLDAVAGISCTDCANTGNSSLCLDGTTQTAACTNSVPENGVGVYCVACGTTALSPTDTPPVSTAVSPTDTPTPSPTGTPTPTPTATPTPTPNLCGNQITYTFTSPAYTSDNCVYSTGNGCFGGKLDTVNDPNCDTTKVWFNPKKCNYAQSAPTPIKCP